MWEKILIIIVTKVVHSIADYWVNKSKKTKKKTVDEVLLSAGKDIKRAATDVFVKSKK
jgi:hypothetical protein